MSRLWDRILFAWPTLDIFKGCLSKDESAYREGYSKYLESERTFRIRPNSSLSFEIVTAERPRLLIAGFLKLTGEISAIFAIHLLRSTLNAYKQKAVSSNETIYWILIIFGVHAFRSFALNHHDFLMNSCGYHTRRALTKAIFSKCTENDGSPKSGQILNLQSNDTYRVSAMFYHLHTIWVAPIQSLLILHSLYGLLGWYAFVGFALTFLYIPLQYSLTKAIKSQRGVYSNFFPC